MIRSASMILVAVVWWATSAHLAAQQPGEAPRFLLNSGGASQPVQALRFSPDGSRLYVAGDHKCVHVWRIPAAPLRPTLETSLHWEISRANLGRIYAMDVAPTGQKLIIGGYSAQNFGGDLALFDVPANKFDRPLPAANRTVQDLQTSGHTSGVNGASFSLDSRRLATIGADGDVLVWSVQDGAIVERLAPRVPQSFDSSRRLPIVYLANGSVVAPIPTAQQVPPHPRSLKIFEPGRPARAILPDDERVTNLAREPNGQRWASLHRTKPHVRLWNQAGQKLMGFDSRRETAEQSGLALGTGGLVLFGEHESPQGENGRYYSQRAPTWLQLWDTAATPAHMLDEVQISTFPLTIACEISPDGRWAATLAGSGEDVWLFPLVDANGARIPKPLSGNRPVMLRGRGTSFWKVAFEETASGDGDYRIGLGIERKDGMTFNNYANISREFDLVAIKSTSQVRPNSRWRAPNAGAAAWEISLVPDEDEGTRLQLRRNGQNAGEIQLHPAHQGRCISYCWIPRENQQLPGLAIGTGGASSGIFVYELIPAKQPRLVRYFRDHQFWVTSLSISRDGKFLASASRDQMVKIWSLAGLFDHPARFPNACAWGAEFVPDGKQLTVQNVQLAGIVASRGLRNGDVVKAVNRKPVLDPQAVVQQLNATPIWETQGFQCSGVRDGKVLNFDEFAITPAWEPLLSLFWDRNQDWAVWTPRGYYDASAEGDKLFGWLVNHKRGEAPTFFRSDQMRQDMERPDVIRQVLLAGNIDTALRAAGEEARIPVANPVREVTVKKLPELRITSPKNKTHFGFGQPVSIEAEARFPSPEAAATFRPEAYVNNVLLAPPVVRAVPGKVVYTWNFEPATSENYLNVKLLGPGPQVTALYVHDSADFSAEVHPPRPRMYFLGLSVNNYPNPKVYRSLQYPHADVEILQKTLAVRQGDYYDLAAQDITHLRDDEITKESVLAQVARLNQQVSSRGPAGQNDLLVIALSGHGDRVESGKQPGYYFITSHPGIAYPGNGPIAVERREAQIQQFGISGEDLFQLATIRCRKIFLLDTCHSGAIEEIVSESAVQANKAAERSLDRRNAFVMTSSAEDQLSWEGGTYRNLELKQGVFTYCLREGILGKADGAGQAPDGTKPNQQIDLRELAEFVRSQVPIITEETRGRLQNPKIVPGSGSDNPGFQIQLVRVKMENEFVSP